MHIHALTALTSRHDNDTRLLLPHHVPKVSLSLRQRTLACYVRALAVKAVDVIGVDVVGLFCVAKGKK